MMLALAAMMLVTTGCANNVQRSAALSGETYTQYPPQAVLDTPELAAYQQRRAQWADEGRVTDEPWWTSRNDERLNLRPGSNAASVTDSLIYVYDRQYSSGNHISNTYQRNSYSTTYGRITN